MYKSCIRKIYIAFNISGKTHDHTQRCSETPDVFCFHLSFDCSFQSSTISIVYYTIIFRCKRHTRIRYKQRHHRKRQIVVSSSGERDPAAGEWFTDWRKAPPCVFAFQQRKRNYVHSTFHLRAPHKRATHFAAVILHAL